MSKSLQRTSILAKQKTFCKETNGFHSYDTGSASVICHQTSFLKLIFKTPQAATYKKLTSRVLTEYIHTHRAQGPRRQTDQSVHLRAEEMWAQRTHAPSTSTNGIKYTIHTCTTIYPMVQRRCDPNELVAIGQGNAGSKTVLEQNRPVLKWECRLPQVDLYGHKQLLLFIYCWS